MARLSIPPLRKWLALLVIPWCALTSSALRGEAWEYSSSSGDPEIHDQKQESAKPAKPAEATIIMPPAGAAVSAPASISNGLPRKGYWSELPAVGNSQSSQGAAPMPRGEVTQGDFGPVLDGNTREQPESIQTMPTPAAARPELHFQDQPEGGPEAAVTGEGSGGDLESPILAGWRDGFFLKSADGAFVLRITGQIQTDYRAFLNDADAVDIDTFLLRRARLGIEADMFQYYEFRFMPDWGQGQAVIQDCYLNIHYWDACMVEVGKFKQPLSYEQLIQDRFVPTVERSMIDQLTPQRDVGAMVHGVDLFDHRFDYALAFSNGEINGNQDTNEHKDFNGRLVVRPFNCSYFAPLLQGLQIGISGGVGVEQEPLNPNTLKTPGTVPWLHYNATVTANGVRSRWTPEVSYFYHGFGMAYQYYEEHQKMSPSSTGNGFSFVTDVPMRGYYVMATCLLTGEERTRYSEAIAPLNPLDPRNPFQCPGAIELVARTSRLEVGQNVFTTGPSQLANPSLNSKGATELTVGFNWYFNKWTRIQCNWEHDWFDDPVQLGASAANQVKNQNVLLTRFQIIF